MNLASLARMRLAKKALVWLLWLSNLVIIVWFWMQTNGPELYLGVGENLTLPIARLSGLIATFCVLVQFTLMSRASWLEPIFGLDKLAIFHRRNGILAITLIFLHAFLMVFGYSNLSNWSILQQILFFIKSPIISLALISVVLFVLVVATSIYIVRAHLKFEAWYTVHLLTYLAIILVFWHQFIIGTDLLQNPTFRLYWVTIYFFAGLNILIWRFGWPLAKFFYHDFRVEKVVKETPTATSVYITGKNMQDFKAEGGQFVLVRFLTKDMWLQEHPFSLSLRPDGRHFRLTIRQLGDFTNQVPSLKVGTKVIVSGPHGSFTHKNNQLTNKTLYIAGGIGITPIRALLEERRLGLIKGDAILLYGNRNLQETALLSEINQICTKTGVEFYNILSEQPSYKGEKGYIDKEKLQHLVPDITERDVYLCGPPLMVNAIMPALQELGINKKLIHFERFTLHKQ